MALSSTGPACPPTRCTCCAPAASGSCGRGRGRSGRGCSFRRPGALFGEVLRPEGSLMEELAVSSGKCEVWSIESRDFRALLEARPALAVDVIRALNERVRQLRQRVLGLTRKDVP